MSFKWEGTWTYNNQKEVIKNENESENTVGGRPFEQWPSTINT